MARRTSRQLSYARRMRRNSTWAEFRLWLALRNNALGLRFRRQEPIGPYIVDFVCLSRKVIVEADGYTHTFDDGGHGERRDRWLTGRGFTVLHFDDDYIYRHLAEVMTGIRRALDANS